MAHHHDAEARWLYEALKQARQQVAHLVPEALGLDYNITLRLNNCGPHGANVSFHQPARRLESRAVAYAINRLSYIDPLVWKKTEPAELTYATSELNAFFPALIESLPCPVSNRIHHGALYGDGGFAARWAARMHERGLAVDASVLDNTGKSYERLAACKPEELHRFMADAEGIHTPPGQATVAREGEIRDCILGSCDRETLEAIFLNEGGSVRLVHLTKVPSLSCYGARYVAALVQQVTKYKHDLANRHSQT
jgi:hypothetical protein